MSRETLGMRTLYQNRITEMIQVRRTAGLYQTDCNSKDTEDQYHVTTEFELCDGGYNWWVRFLSLFLARNVDVVLSPDHSLIREGSGDVQTVFGSAVYVKGGLTSNQNCKATWQLPSMLHLQEFAAQLVVMSTLSP